MTELSTEHSDLFEKDPPWPKGQRPRVVAKAAELIAGLQIELLPRNADNRGELTELLTTRDGSIEPIVHTYAVNAAPGSERAIVYHAKQADRLHFIQGSFKVILMDIRHDSQTYGNKVCAIVGDAAPVRVIIPPYVAHGVKNVGRTAAIFVNMPTRIFERDDPDKYRVSPDHHDQLITFDEQVNLNIA
ncbi:MAG: dTDP-4-dehydrorhamnose 3,5-epimerase family protein [Pseudomonadota bacterium]